MKKRALVNIISVLLLFAVLGGAAYAEGLSVTYDGMKIVADYPTPLDCFLVAYRGTVAEYDEWSVKLFSYDYIPGIDKEIQRAEIVSLEIDGTTITAIDSRNVVYKVDARNGNLLSKNEDNYSVPEYSQPEVSQSGGKGGETAVKFVVAFAVVAIILVFVASRKPKKKK